MDNIYMGLDHIMSKFIYPRIPDHATKDFLEMVEPIHIKELEDLMEYIYCPFCDCWVCEDDLDEDDPRCNDCGGELQSIDPDPPRS